MGKRIIDVPPDKMKSFTKVISPLDSDKRKMAPHQPAQKNSRLKVSQPHLRKIASSFILFDWEFFSNELEYE